MGMIKHYQLKLICLGENQQEQEAIEYALLQGWFTPSYKFEQDKQTIELHLRHFVQKFKQEADENEAIVNRPMQEFIAQIAAMSYAK